MQITTVHTLNFTIRAANGRNQLAEQVIVAACESMKITFGEIKGLPMTKPDENAIMDTTIRTSQVSVFSQDEDQLKFFWGQIEAALVLIGVETSSP